jgi:signal transduction histidine kinase
LRFSAAMGYIALSNAAPARFESRYCTPAANRHATWRSPVLSKWPIRNKLLIGIALLVVIMGVLSIAGGVGVYRYRDLVRSLELRATELPLATRLTLEVADLRVMLTEAHAAHWPGRPDDDPRDDMMMVRTRFRFQLASVESAFSQYREQLLRNDQSDYRDYQTDDSTRERQTADDIATTLDRVRAIDRNPTGWIFDIARIETIKRELDNLQRLSVALPGYMHQKLEMLRNEVRGRYHALIGFVWGATISAALMLAILVRLFYGWIFRPLRVLIKGSRLVAAGDFSHRIRLDTRDEMSELAGCMNDMTDRFQTIRDDLNRQVQLRTKQVVRSEQLASVGFLAAGVAHEINNPLASIAMCAESLESRIDSTLDLEDASQKVIHNYLRMIQDQAFRCKEITEKLLDFSRMGDPKRHNTDLRELVQSVLDMVQHLGKYKDKQVALAAGDGVIAAVNPQQIKQVVLNLVTNALDSVESGGVVTIRVGRAQASKPATEGAPRTPETVAEITVADDGCGMTDEVLEHLFEPFFTRSRCGQGTGLGLSIVFSIVADHDGHIEATSAGPGLGSTFRVTLPLVAGHKQPVRAEKELDHRYQAA